MATTSSRCLLHDTLSSTTSTTGIGAGLRLEAGRLVYVWAHLLRRPEDGKPLADPPAPINFLDEAQRRHGKNYRRRTTDIPSKAADTAVFPLISSTRDISIRAYSVSSQKVAIATAWATSVISQQVAILAAGATVDTSQQVFTATVGANPEMIQAAMVTRIDREVKGPLYVSDLVAPAARNLALQDLLE